MPWRPAISRWLPPVAGIVAVVAVGLALALRLGDTAQALDLLQALLQRNIQLAHGAFGHFLAAQGVQLGHGPPHAGG